MAPLVFARPGELCSAKWTDVDIADPRSHADFWDKSSLMYFQQDDNRLHIGVLSWKELNLNKEHD